MKEKVVICGAGNLGSYAVEEFLKHKDQFDVVVLSRKEQPEFAKQGATVLTVDYNSLEQLTTSLKGASTLISFILVESSDEFLRIHRNLIKSCQQANVKRIVPGDWASDPSTDGHKQLYGSKCDLRHDLEASRLEYTIVGNGLFMNYLLPKQSKKKDFQEYEIPINPEEGTANIPGSGNEPLTLTTCEDIGKSLVELVLYKQKWPKHFLVAGDRTTWNEILEISQKITGKKFTVKYSTVAEIEEKIKSEKDPMGQFNAIVDLCYAKGDVAIPREPTSQEIVKNIKFTTVTDLLQNAYGK